MKVLITRADGHEVIVTIPSDPRRTHTATGVYFQHEGFVYTLYSNGTGSYHATNKSYALRVCSWREVR